MYFIKRLLIFLALLFNIINVQASEIPIIAAAASIKFALQDIAEAFRQDTGKSVRLSFASSGNLTRQIQQGAPFELFLSANTAYINQLQQQKLAPYGVAAQEVLQHQQLWPPIQSHLVLGENVAQATQFTASGAAQVGLVSYSLALAPQLKNKIRFVLIPQTFHQPLAQTMALLNPAGNTAKSFY